MSGIIDITLHTELAYEKKVGALIKRFLRTNSYDNSFDFEQNRVEFLNWIDSLSNTLAPATRRLYRASIVYYYLTQFDYDVLEFNKDFLTSSISKKEVRKKFGKRTSALKVKKMDLKTWSILEPILVKSKSPNAKLALNILRASEYFGLRPIEWSQSEFIFTDENGDGLLVYNAKTTQGRSHGDTRILWFSYDETDNNVKNAVDSANWLITFYEDLKFHCHLCYEFDNLQYDIESREEIDSTLKKARDYLSKLYRTNKVLKKIPINKRITLYSARHQFAANAKKQNIEPEQIAAIMGHGSIYTNKQYYGRKANGHSGFSVTADLDDVEAVRQKMRSDSFTMSP